VIGRVKQVIPLPGRPEFFAGGNPKGIIKWELLVRQVAYLHHLTVISGHLLPELGSVHATGDNQYLIPTKTDDQPFMPPGAGVVPSFPKPSDIPQQLVARHMAVPVVDPFEPIHVNETNIDDQSRILTTGK
jgi:hypothetical protein